MTTKMADKFSEISLYYTTWRGGRVVEGARLEIVYTAKPYRGFESPSLRHSNFTYTIHSKVPFCYWDLCNHRILASIFAHSFSHLLRIVRQIVKHVGADLAHGI